MPSEWCVAVDTIAAGRMRSTSAELETTAKEQKEQRCGALAGLGRPGEVAVPAERGVDFLVEVGGTLVARS